MAVKFLQERKRMFLSGDSSLIYWMGDGKEVAVDPEVLVRNVEQWSAAHPRKTRQSVFLEQWPEAELDTNGAVAICPTILSSDYRSANKRCKHPGTACSDCRREFWMQEVE